MIGALFFYYFIIKKLINEIYYKFQKPLQNDSYSNLIESFTKMN